MLSQIILVMIIQQVGQKFFTYFFVKVVSDE